MSMIYADTNFLTRLYLEREESALASRWVHVHRPCLPVTWLIRVELINALEQAVFTGYGAERARVTRDQAAACQGQFREDLAAGVVIRMVELPLAELTLNFEEIALRHTAEHGFRTYDILHVTAALMLGCRTFWSFDRRACQLAKLEGLKTPRTGSQRS